MNLVNKILSESDNDFFKPRKLSSRGVKVPHQLTAKGQDFRNRIAHAQHVFHYLNNYEGLSDSKNFKYFLFLNILITEEESSFFDEQRAYYVISQYSTMTQSEVLSIFNELKENGLIEVRPDAKDYNEFGEYIK